MIKITKDREDIWTLDTTSPEAVTKQIYPKFTDIQQFIDLRYTDLDSPPNNS